jgi:hypothetical protein
MVVSGWKAGEFGLTIFRHAVNDSCDQCGGGSLHAAIDSARIPTHLPVAPLLPRERPDMDVSQVGRLVTPLGKSAGDEHLER